MCCIFSFLLDKYYCFHKQMCVPLIEAVLQGNIDMAQEVLQLGADPDCCVGQLLKDVVRSQLYFDTPRQLAHKINQEHMINLFTQVSFLGMIEA